MSVGLPSNCTLRAIWIVGCAGLIGLVALATGCIPIPVPGWSSGEIPSDSVRAIEPWKTTRTDVLLMLADPEERLMSDDCFIYRWEENRGGVMIFAGVPMAVPVAGMKGDACHKLVIQFAPSGYVAKVRVFEGNTSITGWFMGAEGPSTGTCSDPELSRRIKEWVEAPANGGQ
jgi:hypothetical protein